MNNENRVNLFSKVPESIRSVKRLNDYDLNILNHKSMMDIDDEAIKLEYTISDKQSLLDALNEKIKGAEKLGNLQDVLSLKIEAKTLENELKELQEKYSKRSLTTKISDGISDVMSKPKTKTPVVIRIQKFISKKILPKISQKFRTVLDLGDSLDTLTSINNNVNELMSLKVPYGETAANYEKLTAYLYKANKIHSQINSKMRTLS